MPELPEIETIKRGIIELHNQTVSNIIIRNGNLRYKITQETANQIIGQKVLLISRRAKYLVLQLTKGYLIIHLGMSGTLILMDTQKSNYIDKHDHVDILFDNGTVLRYNDPRRFGCVVYTDSCDNHPIFMSLGVEPLSDDFNAEYLYNKLKSKKSSIKQLIMESSIVVGIGNIYASEALFMAKISPLRNGFMVTHDELVNLVSSIKTVLTNAIEQGGSTLKDYKQANGSMGCFQNSHFVYDKAGKNCVVCNGTIKSKRLGQRNSFYCPNCQT